MPDNTQEPMNLPPPAVPIGIPDFADTSTAEEDELARQELARISLSNAQLLELAKKNPPLPKWFDEEEAAPF